MVQLLIGSVTSKVRFYESAEAGAGLDLPSLDTFWNVEENGERGTKAPSEDRTRDLLITNETHYHYAMEAPDFVVSWILFTSKTGVISFKIRFSRPQFLLQSIFFCCAKTPNTRGGDRTHNLPLRKRTPYPLGHAGLKTVVKETQQ